MVVILLGVVFFRPLTAAAARALIEDDGPHKAGAVVVLGGDEYCSRILAGAELAARGWAPVVLVSGPEIFGAHESDFTILCATRKGYPAALFLSIPNNSDSTRTESRVLGDYLRAHHIGSILLVTSNYHTRRAAGLFRRRNPGLEVYAEPAPDQFFSPETWWRTRSGQRTFLLEWTKTVATRFGY